MPSRSATSLVDMTSVRVSVRPAGVAIYLREARSRQSGTGGSTSAGASGREWESLRRSVGSMGIHTLGCLPLMATLLSAATTRKMA